MRRRVLANGDLHRPHAPRASRPVPRMAVVNSRPGRYSSTSTGWRNRSSSRTQTFLRASADSTRECSSTPLPVPSARGLANSGNGRSIDLMSSDDAHDAEPGRVQTRGLDHPLGHGLVQRQRADQRIGEGIRNPVHLQQGRHLGLAAAAVQAFGKVEDQVPPFAGGQLPGEGQAVADALDRVAEGLAASAPGRRSSPPSRTRPPVPR